LIVTYDESQPNSQFVSQKLFYIKTLKTKNSYTYFYPTGSIHIKYLYIKHYIKLSITVAAWRGVHRVAEEEAESRTFCVKLM
jgi:hypothetical protein